jgi:arginyl-tRNA synthetase
VNIYKKIERELHVIIETLKAEGKVPAEVDSAKVEATPPRDSAHGEVSTNAAMVIAAQVKGNPRKIAELLVEQLTPHASSGARCAGSQPLSPKGRAIMKADIAGPGFINLTLAPGVWQDAVLDIIDEGVGYGGSEIGKNIKVNIEYVSANPTGPLHVGHGRGAVYGDALSTLLIKSGYSVTKEYYINDAGAQVDKLAESAYLRYREACGEAPVGGIPEGLYPGEYLIPVGQALHRIHGQSLMTKPREMWLPVVRDYAIDAMMQIIKEDLGAIGIQHDIFASERAIRDAGEVDEAVKMLDYKGLIYTGVLEPPKGKPMPEDWEPKPQLLFRSTQFGDDLDRAVKKSDGSWAYITPDIAYHYDKCKRGFHKLIDVFGVDHGGYVKRLRAAVAALSDNEVELEVKLCQLVKFMRGGQPLKMSKRAGTFVTVREVVDEVGKSVFRFIMLTRKNDVPLDFDFAKVMEQSKDNPVFYVQYAHARARSVIRTAWAEQPDAMQMVEKLNLKLRARSVIRHSSVKQPESGEMEESLHLSLLKRLDRPEELALIRLMCGWPRLVEQAAANLEPHRVAFYLQELAAAFHGYWAAGNGDLALRFLVKGDIELTAARVALAHAVSKVIASGLMVLGVEPLEEMR